MYFKLDNDNGSGEGRGTRFKNRMKIMGTPANTTELGLFQKQKYRRVSVHYRFWKPDEYQD